MKLAVPINVRSPKDVMDLCKEISYLKVHAHVYFYVYCTNLSNYDDNNNNNNNIIYFIIIIIIIIIA